VSFDTYQSNARRKEDPGIDNSKNRQAGKTKARRLLQSVASTVNVEALKDGDVAKFRSSLEDARRKLKPVGEFAKRFTLYFNANAHIDAAWLWRDKETIEVCKTHLLPLST